jgi:hypothetical protein
MELVVVDQVDETLDRSPYLLHGRAPAELRLVPGGIEARRHVPERPDPE